MDSCFAKGSVSCIDRSAGGLLGQTYQARIIKNSYSACNVEGSSFVGGVIGDIVTKVIPFVVENCISYSKINGNDKNSSGSFLGGILNTQDGTTFDDVKITNCKTLQQNTNFVGGYFKSGFNHLPDYDVSPMQTIIQGIDLNNTSTNLQVGIKTESASQIDFDTNFELDFGKIVRNGIRSDSALSAIDDFIDLISAKETELGAVSNRLESVLDEIEIQYNNLASSRSTIRDADIAEVSSEYIKMQILQQASSTLLATANQTPSIALQLI